MDDFLIVCRLPYVVITFFIFFKSVRDANIEVILANGERPGGLFGHPGKHVLFR